MIRGSGLIYRRVTYYCVRKNAEQEGTLTRESLVLYNQLTTLWFEGSLVFTEDLRSEKYMYKTRGNMHMSNEWQKYGNGLIYIQTLCNRIPYEYFSAVTDIRELVME